MAGGEGKDEDGRSAVTNEKVSTRAHYFFQKLIEKEEQRRIAAHLKSQLSTASDGDALIRAESQANRKTRRSPARSPSLSLPRRRRVEVDSPTD